MFSSEQSKSAARLLTALSVSAVLSAALTVSSCRTNSGGTDTFIPDAPDWSDAATWYISQPSGDNPEGATAPAADIFYILPTCVWDWTTEDGLTCRYSDYTRTDHIEAFRIFAQGQYGFYCPYYRQISLNVWMDGEVAVEELFPLSMEDISAAFDYYLDNYNEGRPFVLAGFSQGGKAVVELVKHLPAEAYERMVAAYAIGYRISDEEVEQYPQLRPATSLPRSGLRCPLPLRRLHQPGQLDHRCRSGCPQRLGDRHRRHPEPPADSGRPRPRSLFPVLIGPDVPLGQLPPAGTYPLPAAPAQKYRSTAISF